MVALGVLAATTYEVKVRNTEIVALQGERDEAKKGLDLRDRAIRTHFANQGMWIHLGFGHGYRLVHRTSTNLYELHANHDGAPHPGKTFLNLGDALKAADEVSAILRDGPILPETLPPFNYHTFGDEIQKIRDAKIPLITPIEYLPFEETWLKSDDL